MPRRNVPNNYCLNPDFNETVTSIALNLEHPSWQIPVEEIRKFKHKSPILIASLGQPTFSEKKKFKKLNSIECNAERPKY